MSCVHRIDTYFDLKIAWPDQIVTQNRRIYQHGIFYAGIDILSSAPMSRRDLTSWLFVTRDLFIKMNHYTVPSPSKFLNICQKMLLFNRVGFPKSDIRVYISFRFLSLFVITKKYWMHGDQTQFYLNTSTRVIPF